MKLKNLNLFESITDDANNIISDDDIKLIVDKCGPFLKNNLGAMRNGIALYRGLSPTDRERHIKVETELVDIKTDRRPRDSKQFVHNMTNMMLSSYGNINWRTSTLFATTSYYDASEYGDLCFVFPVGEYEMLYSNKISDLIDINSIKAAVKNSKMWLSEPGLMEDPECIKFSKYFLKIIDKMYQFVNEYLERKQLDGKFTIIKDIGKQDTLTYLDLLSLCEILNYICDFSFNKKMNVEIDEAEIKQFMKVILFTNGDDSNSMDDINNFKDEELVVSLKSEVFKLLYSDATKKMICNFYTHLVSRAVDETYVMTKFYEDSYNEDTDVSREVMIHSNVNQAILLWIPYYLRPGLYKDLIKDIAKRLGTAS